MNQCDFSLLMTGGNKGFGAQLLQEFSKTSLGISRSNGYDINEESIRQRIAKESLDYDVFLNYVHVDFAQTLLLYEVYKLWKENRKKGLIVNIGSHGTYEIKPVTQKWVWSKYSLDTANKQCCKELASGQFQFHMTLLKLGFLQDPKNTAKTHWDGAGHSPNEIANLIKDLYFRPNNRDEIILRPWSNPT